ncbi:MAG: hypothetical protein HY423_13905 [Candidatus Lambdaproteobacteria bacterium]|nr:hypothetical protein [Candidatus Lambdaproteobacteria bacterium]
MATSTGRRTTMVSPPVEATRGPDGSLLLVTRGLGAEPAAGRLLRGLTPFLDEQDALNVFLFAERKRREPWRGGETVVAYQELVHWRRDGAIGVYRGVSLPGHAIQPGEVQQAFQYEPAGIIEWAARRGEAAIISSAAPLELTACTIAKPWGREIWFTGIEQRGVCGVRGAAGDTELPYALGLFPMPLVGEGVQAPILLKILDPWPDPVLGDLYLEVHREKWETYIVSRVARGAWPDGVGLLRAGLNRDVLAAHRSADPEGWERKLVAEMREAIGAYEQVRRRIDALLDGLRAQRGLPRDEPEPPEPLRALLAEVPAGLREEEASLRAAVEAFLGKVSLREGDVVALPPGVLHSLQHGIEVVEFQTPTYERLIAMFAQKVVTQPHWDTEQALDWMHKAPFEPVPPRRLLEEGGVASERVVDFPQFQVDRYRMVPGSTFSGKTEGQGAYQLVFGTQGRGQVVLPGGGVTAVVPKQALLLPAELGAYQIQTGAEGCGFLLAFPRRSLPVGPAKAPKPAPDMTLAY